MKARHDDGTIRIGMLGAGTMAGAHSMALTLLPLLYPAIPLRPRLVAVADVNARLAASAAARFGYDRTENDWRNVVDADDIDLVVACMPPLLNREVVDAAAAVGTDVVCEKPLGATAPEAAAMLDTAERAGIFHGLGAGYRWHPALRAIRKLIASDQLGEIRSVRLSFMLDYGADPDVPLLWRFRRSVAGGGLALDTGYHLADCARFLVGEIASVQALTRIFIPERDLPGADATGNRGSAGGAGTVVEGAPNARARGPVDVEDAAAALLTFENGAYGVLETTRVAIGRRTNLEIEVFGSRGSADWDLESGDEFRVCLPGDAATFGYRRVLVSAEHPGAAESLVAGTEGTSIGWLGQEVAMWAEFLTAIAEGRSAHANFEDGVAANAVIDALYAAADTGSRTPVEVPRPKQAGTHTEA